MDNTRNYILDRLMSRTVTVDEFNFDALQAPPLSMFLTPADIQEITSVALSLKLSARPDERYRLIDQVMNRRGMVRFLTGTNRASYRHPEFPNILFKVATDAVGIKDNPAEFYNQQFLKPFVPKMFEVSPGGAVAIEEKVEPITSREEFLSVADDIFELITEWLVGEYVLADFGTKFFMNYGIRKGFGCVILDFPYVYKLDGNKLFCNKPDPTSPTGKCEGIIDYDAGYNFLHCTKCGATYKAKELEQKIKNNEIISSIEGESKMNIIIKGGSKAVEAKKFNMLGDNPNFKESVAAIYNHNTSDLEESTDKFNETYDKDTDTVIKVRTSRSVKVIPVEPVDSQEIKVPAPQDIKAPVAPLVTKIGVLDQDGEIMKEETPKVETPVVKVLEPEPEAPAEEPVKDEDEEKVEEKRLSVNGVSNRAVVAVSPVEFSTTEKDDNYVPEATVSPVKDIEVCINKIFSSLNMIDIDIVKDDIIERLFLSITSALPNTEKSLAMLVSAAKDMIDSDCTADEDTIEDIKSICKGVGVEIATYDNESEGEPDCSPEKADEDAGEDTAPLSVKSILENNNISYVELISGKIMDLADIFPNTGSQKIIALFDSNDSCIVTDKGSMLAIDVVDDTLVQDMTLVSTEYLDNVERLAEYASESVQEVSTVSDTVDTTVMGVTDKQEV